VLLRGRERTVHPDPHRTEPHRAVEREDDVDVVGQRPRHPVAHLHPELRERVGGPVGEAVELGVGPAPAAGDERLALRFGGEDAVEDLGHRAGDLDRRGLRHGVRAMFCSSIENGSANWM
jgi:hypothetical protein